MSNTSNDTIPVFGERTDLNERQILYPEWPRQLPTDTFPVYGERTDLNERQILYPEWPRQLPTDTFPVFGERTDLNERQILYPEWPKQLPTDTIPVYGERTDLNERQILYPEWPKQLPTDTIPVYGERTDLYERPILYPEWPRQLPTISPSDMIQEGDMIPDICFDTFDLTKKKIPENVEMEIETVTTDQAMQLPNQSESQDKHLREKKTFKRGLSHSSQESSHKKQKDPNNLIDNTLTNDLTLENEIQKHLKTNPMCYSIEFLEFKHLNERKDSVHYQNFESFKQTYNLRVKDVRGDGNCFINAIIEFYKIFNQETLLNKDVVKYCYDFLQNPEVNEEFYKNYITSFLATNPAIDNDGQQIEYCETFVKEKMYSDMKRYFYSKEYIDNQFLDLLIQYAAKICCIDFLIIQRVQEVKDADDITQYMVLRYLYDEKVCSNVFIALYKTSKDNNSHFQLLIPATYDVKKTKRDNIISKLTNPNASAFPDDFSIAIDESMSHSGNFGLSVKGYNLKETDQIMNDELQIVTSQRPPSSYDDTQPPIAETDKELNNADFVPDKNTEENIEDFPMEELNSQLSELSMLPISSSAKKRSDDFKEYFKAGQNVNERKITKLLDNGKFIFKKLFKNIHKIKYFRFNRFHISTKYGYFMDRSHGQR
jgi:hypothetical protein